MEASQSESAETVLKVAEATGELAISTPVDDDDDDDDNQVVTPWEVTGTAQVNYAKLGGPICVQTHRRRARRPHRAPYLQPAAPLPPPRHLLCPPVTSNFPSISTTSVHQQASV
jgi:hypothetical protein